MTAALRLNPIHLDDTLKEEVKQSVISILKEGFSIDATLENYHVVHGYVCVGDVSGIVGMVQSHLVGNLIISFSRDSLSCLLAKVYGHEFESVSNSMKEGVAEVANMIYGSLKVKLNSRGHHLEMSLPSVIVGPGHNVSHSEVIQSGVFTFRFKKKFTFQVIVTVNSLTEQ